tara:strand:- start:267 stop:776 length:510 start_codon:yes stop_codon:yes gene_type:complete
MAIRKNSKEKKSTAGHLKIVQPSNLVSDPKLSVDNGEVTMGGRIQKAREARGLTVSQLARRTGVLSKTVHKWETNRSEPRANKLQLLAGVLSVPPLWLLNGEGSPLELYVMVNTDETANLQGKVDRLLELHKQSSRLMFEIQSEVMRLQGNIDAAPDHALARPDDGSDE